jgi:hypothetical protein
MTDGSMPPPPPCALLVMCNECGSGTEMPLPIDREGLARFLILPLAPSVGAVRPRSFRRRPSVPRRSVARGCSGVNRDFLEQGADIHEH